MLDKQGRSLETQSSPWKRGTCRYVTKVTLKFLTLHKRRECRGLGNCHRADQVETMATPVAFSITLIATDCHWRCGRTGPGGRLRGRGNRGRGRLSGVPGRRQRGGSEGRRRGRSWRHGGRRRWCSRRWWDCDVRWRRGEAWNSWFDRGMVSTATTGLCWSGFYNLLSIYDPQSPIWLHLACSIFLWWIGLINGNLLTSKLVMSQLPDPDNYCGSVSVEGKQALGQHDVL